MTRTIAFLILLLGSQAGFAISPYLSGEKVNGGDIDAVLAQVEKKLLGQGFAVVGRHKPAGLAQHAALVVTDPGMLDAVRSLGGSAIVAAAIRIGVKADGTVSFMNPDYWYRAFLRSGFDKHDAAAKAVLSRLRKALGDGAAFGGDVEANDLPNYRYMFGMERFDSSRNELNSFPSFDEAVRTVRDNLSRNVGGTAKVYEIVMPAQKIAAFGVAMNDPESGEGYWVKKIGPDHIAAMPYELYVVDGKVNAFYGRYRIALSWPALTMGTFMGIFGTPDAILETMTRVAGAPADRAR